jgi:hypothetical protein
MNKLFKDHFRFIENDRNLRIRLVKDEPRVTTKVSIKACRGGKSPHEIAATAVRHVLNTCKAMQYDNPGIFVDVFCRFYQDDDSELVYYVTFTKYRIKLNIRTGTFTRVISTS